MPFSSTWVLHTANGEARRDATLEADINPERRPPLVEPNGRHGIEGQTFKLGGTGWQRF